MPGSSDGPASVDRQAGSRDVLRGSAAEKGDEGADGFHSDETAGGLALRQVVEREALDSLAGLCRHGRDLALDGGRWKGAGGDRIAGNSGARRFQRDRAGEAKD